MKGGPWGPVGDVIIAILPIVFLLAVTLKSRPLPSKLSLPASAVILYVLRLAYFGSSPALTSSAVISGILNALTPITIVFGAVFLFDIMDRTQCMAWILAQLKILSRRHRIAELMLIGWAFIYLIEGASGFGTPTALAAPILVQLGVDPMDAVVACLIFNTLQTPFGAVGTPIWFGLQNVVVTSKERLELSLRVQVLLSGVALIVAVLALLQVVSWQEVYRNKIFVYLCLLSAIIPALGLAAVSYELPTLGAGIVSIAVIGALVHYEIGMAPPKQVEPEALEMQPLDAPEEESHYAFTVKEAIWRTFPFWAIVLVLILTRIPEFKIRGILTSTEPSVKGQLGTLGELLFSASLVVQLKSVLGIAQSNWSYAILFVPAWLPFVFVSIATCFIHRKSLSQPVGQTLRTAFGESFARMKNPSIALMGATTLVALMTLENEQDPAEPRSPAVLLGSILAGVLQEGWIAVSMLIGAIGAFFSGSTTVSNLTFGQVQVIAAMNANLSKIGILALQTIGASMGNMICIHNILAAKVVAGLDSVPEGVFMRRCIVPFLAFYLIGTLLGLAFVFV